MELPEGQLIQNSTQSHKKIITSNRTLHSNNNILYIIPNTNIHNINTIYIKHKQKYIFKNNNRDIILFFFINDNNITL